MKGVCKYCGCTENTACYHPDYGNCWWVDDSETVCSHCQMTGKDVMAKKTKAKHNLIYRIRKAGQGRVVTSQKTIYFFYEEPEKVTTRKHVRLQKEYGFMIQSELVK